MNTRDHHVAGQAPDWRVAKPGHKAPPRRLPKAVRKALRAYRRNVIPMAEHRDPVTWPTLALIGAVAIAILLWQAGCFQ